MWFGGSGTWLHRGMPCQGSTTCFGGMPRRGATCYRDIALRRPLASGGMATMTAFLLNLEKRNRGFSTSLARRPTSASADRLSGNWSTTDSCHVCICRGDCRSRPEPRISSHRTGSHRNCAPSGNVDRRVAAHASHVQTHRAPDGLRLRRVQGQAARLSKPLKRFHKTARSCSPQLRSPRGKACPPPSNRPNPSHTPSGPTSGAIHLPARWSRCIRPAVSRRRVV